MNSMGVSLLRSSARGVISTVPGAGWVRSRGSADRAFPRWLAGPLPVLMIGAVVAIGQAVSHAWVSLDASLHWQASARLDNLYADG
jgi:hypothetical protein